MHTGSGWEQGSPHRRIRSLESSIAVSNGFSAITQWRCSAFSMSICCVSGRPFDHSGSALAQRSGAAAQPRDMYFSRQAQLTCQSRSGCAMHQTLWDTETKFSPMPLCLSYTSWPAYAKRLEYVVPHIPRTRPGTYLGTP